MVGFSWVDLAFWLFHPLLISAWSDGKLAQLNEQASKMVNIVSLSQPNHGPRPAKTPAVRMNT